MNKEEFSKIHAFNCIMKHLDVAKNDHRKRERIRALTALSHIKQWHKE